MSKNKQARVPFHRPLICILYTFTQKVIGKDHFSKRDFPHHVFNCGHSWLVFGCACLVVSSKIITLWQLWPCVPINRMQHLRNCDCRQPFFEKFFIFLTPCNTLYEICYICYIFHTLYVIGNYTLPQEFVLPCHLRSLPGLASSQSRWCLL